MAKHFKEKRGEKVYSDQITLPTKSMIAGTSKKFEIFLYTEDLKKQIDATGMTARFVIADYINAGSQPLVTKACTISVPAGEAFGIINVSLLRADTISLAGKYIYQVSIKDGDTDAALKGILEIAENQDKK